MNYSETITLGINIIKLYTYFILTANENNLQLNLLWNHTQSYELVTNIYLNTLKC